MNNNAKAYDDNPAKHVKVRSERYTVFTISSTVGFICCSLQDLSPTNTMMSGTLFLDGLV
jgi:hypothetical protein